MKATFVVYCRAAVQTLGLIGADAMPPLLEQLTTNENETIRTSCAKALAAIALNFPEEPFATEALEGLQKEMGGWGDGEMGQIADCVF